MADDPEAARRRCDRFMALAEKTATGVVQPQADVVDGWARARLGDGEAGLVLIRAGRAGIPKALALVGVRPGDEMPAAADVHDPGSQHSPS